MIWIRKIRRERGTAQGGNLQRALSWLLLLTIVFGLLTAVLMTVVTGLYPQADWLPPLVLASLCGLSICFLGALILFLLHSARTLKEE